jgi:SufS family cysteine desulfurase
MTASDPEQNKNGTHPQNVPGLQTGNARASDFLNVDVLANIANELMDIMPPAGKAVRESYAGQVNEVFLENVPSEISGYGFSVPSQDQLHRLPETIAKGDTPKTPTANKDFVMQKSTDMLRNESANSMPYAFLNEIRSLFPEHLENWSLPAVAAAQASAPVFERVLEDLHIEEAMRSLEPVGYLAAPQIPGSVAYADAARNMGNPQGYADQTNAYLAQTNAQFGQANSYIGEAGNYMGQANSFAQMSDPIEQAAKFAGAQSFSHRQIFAYDDPFSAAGRASGAGSQGISANPMHYGSQPFDVELIRRDFPILQEKVNGRNLVWLDNAATTQKPKAVIDRLSYFYTHENSNIHRAAHELAARSTDAYEGAREDVRRFLNASSASEIVFVRGATEAINLVAQAWGRQYVQKDDEILITWLEHHANIVPWQMLAAETGARLKVAPVNDRGEIVMDEYQRLLTPRTRLVALTQVSNALGTITPVEEMVAAAHRVGAKVLVDGAQAVSHMAVDVQQYDCDFYVLSGHKLFAPTGIGVLYGKQDILENMRPWQGGGNMIKDVKFEHTVYNQAPVRFEAGTGSIADAVGLGAAIRYIERIGMHNISKHEDALLAHATQGMLRIPGLHLIGTASKKAGVLSFVMDGYETSQISSALNQQGIAVRAGHHCAQPILRRFGLESTVRPSLAFYNNFDDIDALVAALWDLKQGRSAGLI